MLLNQLDSFGDVAAEDDAVLDYFLSTNAVDNISSSRAFLVLGRKGTGKTAIVRYFTESHSSGLSKSLNLRGYPWNVHASRVDRGASDIEAYVSSWRYLIAVELCSLVVSDSRGGASHCAGKIKEFLRDNYGGNDPALSDILRPSKLRLSRLSIQPSVMGNQLGGVALDRDSGDHRLGLELNLLSSALIDAVLEVAQDASLGSLSVHFDELDQGLSEFNANRQLMLIGLIIAARELKRESSHIGGLINPVVYLRSDLWDELQFSDKNKITQTLTLNLGWSSSNLLDLVNARLQAKLGNTIGWKDIAALDLMRGSQTKWNHILARIFLRPRDVIRFLNATLSEAKRRNSPNLQIINEDIVASRDEYSIYLKAELDDEIRPHWPNWDESLQACSALTTLTFEREDFIREYQRRKSSANKLGPIEALSMLYKFSVIGYERRSGYGGKLLGISVYRP